MAGSRCRTFSHRIPGENFTSTGPFLRLRHRGADVDLVVGSRCRTFSHHIAGENFTSRGKMRPMEVWVLIAAIMWGSLRAAVRKRPWCLICGGLRLRQACPTSCSRVLAAIVCSLIRLMR